ncbi:MAG: MurR/RpiR family transcriptional regulator, partial [Oscillospiraceae bacterium]|nr:MurR/RpiR family transcriptional regulator [Oscillospiraceae bacterium]
MSGKLEQRIQSAHLTRTEKVIADYFLEHSGSLYFLTAKDIALALGVSDTSVIRLCRTLGYRGFRELQESLRSELSQVIEREKYVIPQHQVPDKLQKYQDLSSFQCLQFAVDCLQETYR